MTGEPTWDSSVLDHNHEDEDQWLDAVSELDTDSSHNLFDEFGNYRYRIDVQSVRFLNAHAEPETADGIVDRCVLHAHTSEVDNKQFPS